MDQTKSEYEFLDLSDINEEERSCLTSALFPTPLPPPHHQPTQDTLPHQVAWSEPHYVHNDVVNLGPVYVLHTPHSIIDISSCSSETVGPPTASSSLDSLSEREMAPPPPSVSPPHAPRPPPPHYHTPHPPPHNQPQLYTQPPWAPPLMPSNVYVSQVTANVNVHGYMSQYYQPHQHQYVAHQPPEQRGNPNREGGGGGRRGGRRGGPNKRVPSPSPPQPAPPYIYYPQYYPAQAAQGAPLYHMPVYQQYIPSYQYAPYVEYPIMEDPSGGEKPPEDYHTEMMMEHEHISHEVYYPPPHQCIPPPHPNMYDPNRADMPMEPYSTTYYPVPPPHQPAPHQFNVHAKNFVRQSDHKNYNNEVNKPQDTNANNNSQPNNNTNNVDALPVKELKISSNNKTQNNSGQNAVVKVQNNQQHTVSNEKVTPKPPVVESPKPAWSGTDNASSKTSAVPSKPVTPPPVNSQVAATPQPVTQVTVPVTSNTSKAATSPVQASTAPVTQPKGDKSPVPSPTPATQPVKATPPPATNMIPIQQTVPAKAPFSSNKKDVSVKPSESAPTVQPVQTNEVIEFVSVNSVPAPVDTKPVVTVPTVKPNPPVSIAPTPIVSKAPFSHAKKPSISETPVPPTEPPQPVAPSANDFPPVPAPKRVAEPPPPSTQPAPVVPHNPSPVRSWASLFVNKTAVTTVVNKPEEVAPVVTPPSQPPPLVNNVTPQTASAVVNQKPVAKVGPFDASPLQRKGSDKPQNQSTQMISYSEKTSNGQVQKNLKEDTVNRDWQQSQAAAHINDPNSYRMGEFLSKYQLSHHTVSLQPRGLSNRSNYCYINAILQALIACPPFYNMLKNLPHQARKGKSSTPIIDAMVELIHEFSPLPPGVRPNRAERLNRAEGSVECGSLVGGAGPPLEPGPVLRALRDVHSGGDSFRVDGRQEDAEEFLGCLLNGLNDEMMELIKLVEPEETKEAPIVNGNDGNSHPGNESEDDDEWKVMGPKNKGSIERRCLAGRTPLSDIFRGQLRSRLQRVQTSDSTQSETTHCVQPFFTLPLDIENCCTVSEALERVAGKERMEGVRCRERGRPVDAWSQSLLEKLPPALLLHLKCFHCRPHDNTTAKILKTIEYPVDLKIDPKIMSSKIKYSPMQRLYKLFAVVYHEGSELEKGHYLCDAYHAGSGGWLRYDDSVVTAVTENQVLHPKLPRTPYLLLYRRKDTMQSIQRHNNNSSNNN